MDVWLAPRSFDHHRPSSIPAFWSRSNLPDRTQKFGVKILERSKREKDPIRKYFNWSKVIVYKATEPRRTASIAVNSEYLYFL